MIVDRVGTVTCRYLDSHEERERMDKEREKQEAADRYWRVRDFNPVTTAYYDESKVCWTSLLAA
jgi:hypothetical protein